VIVLNTCSIIYKLNEWKSLQEAINMAKKKREEEEEEEETDEDW